MPSTAGSGIGSEVVIASALQSQFRRAILGGMTSMAYRVISEKGHSFSVEMNNLKGKCSLIPGFRDKSEADAWIVQTKRMLHEPDPTERVIARKSRKH